MASSSPSGDGVLTKRLCRVRFPGSLLRGRHKDAVWSCKPRVVGALPIFSTGNGSIRERGTRSAKSRTRVRLPLDPRYAIVPIPPHTGRDPSFRSSASWFESSRRYPTFLACSIATSPHAPVPHRTPASTLAVRPRARRTRTCSLVFVTRPLVEALHAKHLVRFQVGAPLRTECRWTAISFTRGHTPCGFHTRASDKFFDVSIRSEPTRKWNSSSVEHQIPI